MAEEDIKKILKDYKDETKRHFDVVAERLEDKIGVLSEQVAVNSEDITVIKGKIGVVSEQVAVNSEDITVIKGKIGVVSEQVAVNSEDITVIKKDVSGINETLGIIKLDIEFIKNELKQKVGRDEFAALERRVSILEAKQR